MHSRIAHKFARLAAGVLVGSSLALGAVGAAQAAKPLSPVEKLIIENDIRQQIDLFAMLADGDGTTHKDMRALADKVLAPDIVTDVYAPNGTVMMHTTTSQAVIDATPPYKERPTAGRHFVVATYFDEVTPTTAKTRTTALYMEVQKYPGPGCEKDGPAACGGQVTHGVTVVYHDTWKKTANGWRKATSALYRDN